MKLVLASGSRWRRELLAAAGVHVLGIEHRVDERSFGDLPPVELATTLALEKARSVVELAPEALIIGADQVVHLDGRRFDKPRDAAEQQAHLRTLRGRTHQLVTGVAVVGPGVERVFHEATRVSFRADVSDDEIAAYVATGEGRGSAGGYEIEGRGAQLAEAIEGSWFNIVGLPVLPLVSTLRELGWRPSF